MSKLEKGPDPEKVERQAGEFDRAVGGDRGHGDRRHCDSCQEDHRPHHPADEVAAGRAPAEWPRPRHRETKRHQHQGEPRDHADVDAHHGAGGDRSEEKSPPRREGEECGGGGQRRWDQRDAHHLGEVVLGENEDEQWAGRGHGRDHAHEPIAQAGDLLPEPRPSGDRDREGGRPHRSHHLERLARAQRADGGGEQLEPERQRGLAHHDDAGIQGAFQRGHQLAAGRVVGEPVDQPGVVPPVVVADREDRGEADPEDGNEQEYSAGHPQAENDHVRSLRSQRCDSAESDAPTAGRRGQAADHQRSQDDRNGRANHHRANDVRRPEVGEGIEQHHEHAGPEGQRARGEPAPGAEGEDRLEGDARDQAHEEDEAVERERGDHGRRAVYRRGRAGP